MASQWRNEFRTAVVAIAAFASGDRASLSASSAYVVALAKLSGLEIVDELPRHDAPVEVVGGERTAPATIEGALAFYKAIGKRPIHIRREVAGHVANRLQAALWREAVHLVAAGVASVADIDTAISEGPGLRWALMGPHLTFHLAGGSGGMAHFLEQLGPPLESWWDDLGDPQLTPEVRQALTAGVSAEAEGRDIATLAAERDRFLVDLLALKGARRDA